MGEKPVKKRRKPEKNEKPDEETDKTKLNIKENKKKIKWTKLVHPLHETTANDCRTWSDRKKKRTNGPVQLQPGGGGGKLHARWKYHSL